MSENDVMIRGIIEGLRSVLDEFGADIVRECIQKLVEDNKEFVLEEICKRVALSLTRSKAYKEKVNGLLESIQEA